MKIVTWNVNGIRAAERKGFLGWLATCDADVVFLQEIKANEEQLSDELRAPKGWHVEMHSAQRPGYSGVALYSRDRPDEVGHGLKDHRFDAEGRVIASRFGDLHLIGAYFPNGARDHSRVPFKLDFYAAMLEHVNALRRQGLKVLLCGDWNTAHEEIDLARPKENQKTTGFLPHEREWVTKFLSHGWTDAFRKLHPDARERYSWWAAWGGARQKNIGWRLDYHVVDDALLPHVRASGIHDEILGSDHCPVSIELQAGPRRIPVTSASTATPEPAPSPAPLPPKPRASAKAAKPSKPSRPPKGAPSPKKRA